MWRCSAFLILVCCACICYTQTLTGSVDTVTQYDSCAVSPLGSSPLNQGGPSNNFTSPCSQLPGGSSSKVTEIRLTVLPKRVLDQENLVFTQQTTFNISHVLTAAQSGDFDITQPCSGVPQGAPCNLFTNTITISIESTALYATYQLLKKRISLPYAYKIYQCQTDGNVGVDSDVPFFVNTVDCADAAKEHGGCYEELGNYKPGVSDSGSAESVCPADFTTIGSAGASKFYDPPASTTMDSKCNVLYCRTNELNQNGQPWVSQTFVRVNPVCAIFDVLSRPSALMNIKLKVTVGSTTQELILSTDQGGAIQSIPGLMYARINDEDTGIGLLGNTISGNIVTCNTCSKDMNQNNCDLGVLQDAASTSSDGFTIQNPWSTQSCKGQTGAQCTATNGNEGLRDCNLPSSLCRKNIGATPSDAWWYYVPPEFSQQYGTGCNENGVTNDIYNLFDIQAKVCNVASLCGSNGGDVVCGSDGGVCVPAYQQATLGSNFRRTETPCQVSQYWANLLEQYTNIDNKAEDRFKEGYFFMPPGYQPPNPQFWIQGSRLITPALGGTSDEVGIDLSIYIDATFLGDIQTASTGVFVGVGQFCSAVDGGSGSAAAQVRNTGNVPGTFTVTCKFITDESSSITIEAEGISFDEGTLTAEITMPIAANSFDDFDFQYQYQGTSGTSVQVQFTLFTVAGNGQLAQLQQETIGCTVVASEQFNPQIGQLNTYVGQDQQQCTTFELTCWDDLSVWDWIMRILVFILVGVIFIIIFVSSVGCCVRYAQASRNLKKQQDAIDKGTELKHEYQELKRQEQLQKTK